MLQIGYVFLSVLIFFYTLGKPAYEMSKFVVDWAPCINLGHEKINVSTLQAASDRATRTEMR